MNQKSKIRLTQYDEEQLQELRTLILQKPTRSYSIVLLSQSTGLNRHKLTYGFKQVTGYSIHQFLIKARMENAKMLLQKTDKPIKEIAQLSGYKSHEKFTHAFKKYFGISPSQLRINK